MATRDATCKLPDGQPNAGRVYVHPQKPRYQKIYAAGEPSTWLNKPASQQAYLSRLIRIATNDAWRGTALKLITAVERMHCARDYVVKQPTHMREIEIAFVILFAVFHI